MEKVLNKIRKLLELSKSSNEHEAALAAARAAQLMLEHQLEVADLEAAGQAQADEPIVEEAIGEDGKIVHWHASIASGLAESMGAQAIVFADRRGRAAHYMVIGPPSTLAAVRYMYAYLAREIDRLANAAYKRECTERAHAHMPEPSARRWKASFRVGAAHVVRERLNAQREATLRQARESGHGQALMVLDRKGDEIDRFVKQHHPRLRTMGSSAGQGSRSGYQAGRSAGQGIALGGGDKALGAGQGRLRP